MPSQVNATCSRSSQARSHAGSLPLAMSLRLSAWPSGVIKPRWARPASRRRRSMSCPSSIHVALPAGGAEPACHGERIRLGLDPDDAQLELMEFVPDLALEAETALAVRVVPLRPPGEGGAESCPSRGCEDGRKG